MRKNLKTMLKVKIKKKHVTVIDKKGTDYLCPVKLDQKSEALVDIDSNVCFEKDVPGRYAARINI